MRFVYRVRPKFRKRTFPQTPSQKDFKKFYRDLFGYCPAGWEKHPVVVFRFTGSLCTSAELWFYNGTVEFVRVSPTLIHENILRHATRRRDQNVERSS